ncbi:MAG: 6-phosphogluconolactonase [Candidatus Dojkabacteria bacterium]
MQFLISSKPEIEAAKHLSDLLAKKLLEGRKVLLLLAGGSAEKVYNRIPEFLSIDDFSNLTVMMGDERWDKDPKHMHADWEMFRETRFHDQLLKGGASLINLLSGGGHQQEAQDFNDELNEYLARSYFTIIMLGIGADGHIAGILPASKSMFSKTFYGNELAVAHELDTVHPKRITITPGMIKKADEVFVFAVGDKKRNILLKLHNVNRQHPNKEWSASINKCPALILCSQDVNVYTDQNIV